jgi:hypothetical protein
MDDFDGLLTAAPADSATAERLYERLVGADQGLHKWISALTTREDRETLRVLYGDRCTVHELVDEYAPPYGRPAEPLGFPYRRSESAQTHAVRALAALGLARLDPQEPAFRDAAERWYATTNAAVDGDEQSLPVAAGLAALQTGPPTRQRPARVGVVLAEDGDGRRVELRATHHHHLPRGIAADPRTMSTFTADGQFHAALGTAYTLAGRRLAGGVLYSLHADERPVDHVVGGSMGVATCVILDELAGRRNWRWLLRVRRLRTATYIAGKVTPSGRTESVSQYSAKVRGLSERSRLVVPRADKEHVPEFGGTVVGVTSWHKAARAARRIDRWAVATRAVAVALVVATVATFFGLQQARRAERDRDLQVASHLAEEATDRIRGDSDGTALLLAMASDDLSRSHGRSSNVFDGLARDYASLLSIVRPPQGRFQQGTIDSDGTHAMLSTASGLVQIVALPTDTVEWQRQYPPATELLLPEQARVVALAFGDNGYAAYATNDRRIVLLQRTGSTWRETATVDLDVPSKKYKSQVELNYAGFLAFHGDRLLTLGNDPSFGVLAVSLADPHAPHHRCPVEAARHFTITDAGTALLTYERRVVSVDPDTCTQRTVLEAPAGVELHVAEVNKEEIVGLGTTESRIIAVRSTGEPVELANDGPYFNARLSIVGEDLEATASTADGTFGWRIAESAQVFGMHSAGVGVRRGDYLLWIHDGLAEVHSPDRNLFSAVRRFYYPAVTMTARWAGPDLLLGRAGGGVTLVRAAATSSSDEMALDVRMPVPAKLNAVLGLAAEGSGASAAAIVIDPDHAGSNTLVVWDMSTLEPMRVELPPKTIPISLAYLDNRLYVGTRAKQVMVLDRRDDAWRVTGTTTLNGNPVAIAASPVSGTVGAITTNAFGGPADIVTIDARGLAVLKQRPLPEAPGPWSLLALRRGGFVAAYGSGKVVFLDNSLVIMGMLGNLRFPYVDGLTQVAGRDEIMVSGARKVAVIDVPTRSVLRDERWGRAGSVMGADTNPDGRHFATYDWMSMMMTVWVMDPALLRKRACAAIGRELTQEEWLQYTGGTVHYRKVCAA